MRAYKTELAACPFSTDPELTAIAKNRYAFSARHANNTRTKIALRLHYLGVPEQDMRTMFSQTLMPAPPSPAQPPAESPTPPPPQPPAEAPADEPDTAIESPSSEIIATSTHTAPTPRKSRKNTVTSVAQLSAERAPPRVRSIIDVVRDEYPSSVNIEHPRDRTMTKAYKVMKNPARYGVNVTDQTNFVDVYNAIAHHESSERKAKYGWLNTELGAVPVHVPSNAAPSQTATPPTNLGEYIPKLTVRRS